MTNSVLAFLDMAKLFKMQMDALYFAVGKVLM